MKAIRSGLFLALLLVLVVGGCKKKSESSVSSGTTAATVSVSSVSPADGAASVAVTTALEITFSEKMAASSVTVSADTACTGSLQLSANDFSTCIALGDPTSDSTGKVFTATPKANLANGTTYKMKVTTSATNESGTALSSEYSSTQGFITVSATATATADTTAPASPGITINSGASLTDNKSVSLVLSATDAVGVNKVFVSTSSAAPAASDTGWVSVTAATSLSSTTSYTLPSTTGAHTLYAWFQDAAGNVSTSASASITLVLWPGTIQIGTSVNDVGFAGVMSPNNKLYIAGYTAGSIGAANAGGNDFIARWYDLNGTTGWTAQLGSSADDAAYGLALDGSENVYVAGSTMGTFDGGTFAGSTDIALTKYNSSGTKQWSLEYGTVNGDIAYAVAADSAGNSYLTGFTRGGLDGNSLMGIYDIFLSKVSSSGTLQWTKQFGYASGIGFAGRGVAVDSAGNIIMVGYADKPFDGNSIVGTSDSIVIYKCDSAGNKIWSKQISSASIEEAYGVAVNGTTIYVVGYSTGTIGGTQAGAGDLFLGSYDTNGNQNWTTQLGTSAQEYGLGVTVDKSGNIYVTGKTAGAFTGSNAGGMDIFVAKYDSAGTKQWVSQIGTASDDIGQAVTTDSLGNVYVTGFTGASLDGKTYNGGLDTVILKYSSSGVLQ